MGFRRHRRRHRRREKLYFEDRPKPFIIKLKKFFNQIISIFVAIFMIIIIIAWFDPFTAINTVDRLMGNSPTSVGALENLIRIGADQIDSEAKNESIKAFEYMNSLRKENGVRELEWNENLYELALFRAKDMSERNYFSHKTPDGKCAMTYYASTYGVRGTPGENIGEGHLIQKDAVDGWMRSEGHRYNMMHATHISGAIAKYKDEYVFLGLGTQLWTCPAFETSHFPATTTVTVLK